MVFDSISLPQKKCFRKNVFVCLWPSSNVGPKPIGRSRSNSISRVLLKISQDFFSFPVRTPNVKSSWHKKKLNFRFTQKWLQLIDYILWVYSTLRAKGNWDFQISYLVKNPDMELIFNPCGVNVGEVRRAQLSKSTLPTSSLVPLGSFQIF